MKAEEEIGEEKKKQKRILACARMKKVKKIQEGG